MIEQIYTYFSIEMIYLWLNLGVLPFWFILIFFPQSRICKIFTTSIIPIIIFKISKDIKILFIEKFLFTTKQLLLFLCKLQYSYSKQTNSQIFLYFQALNALHSLISPVNVLFDHTVNTINS